MNPEKYTFQRFWRSLMKRADFATMGDMKNRPSRNRRRNVMKITGIIAEYNPFHTGHAYHLKKARESSGCDYTTVLQQHMFVYSLKAFYIAAYKLFYF